MMSSLRVMPRLDVKGENVVKGIHLEGLRVVGKPGDLAQRYYANGADELIFMDIVASLYGRNNILSVVEAAAKNIFVPMTVGGGIRSLEDVKAALRSGADKVAINTAAIARPQFLREAAEAFGSQCVVLSVEAKRRGAGQWEALTDNGRERTGRDVLQWVEEASTLGIGEVLITSVDQEGTRKGLDLDLIEAISHRVQVPVVACGGVGGVADVENGLKRGILSGIACASIFHYGIVPLPELKQGLRALNREVRL